MINVNSVLAKRNFHNFLLFDKTYIYLQLIDKCHLKSVPVYLATCFGNPDDLKGQEDFRIRDIFLERNLVYDYNRLQ